MLVTINTDASFSTKNQKGAFAFWIASNHGRICRSGILKGTTIDPTHAEMKTIINAVYTLFNYSEWFGIKKIIINTDSLNSIHLFTHNIKAIQKYKLKHHCYRKPVALFDELIKSSKVNFEMRHVRSHQGTDTPKRWVNEWCDQEAKKHIGDYLIGKK